MITHVLSEIYNEDEFETAWNSEEHFLLVAHEETEEIKNPLGFHFVYRNYDEDRFLSPIFGRNIFLIT